MFKSGLMLLSCIPQLNRLSSYLRAANQTITNTLYISIEPNLLSSSSVTNTQQKNKCKKQLIKIVPQIYAEANRSVPYLDVRVLHHSYYHKSEDSSPPLRRTLQFVPQVVLINGSHFSEEKVRKYLINEFNLSIEKIQSIPESDEQLNESEVNGIDDKVFDFVCLGGTFDNLHNGHKVLLSSAQLRCDKCVTIGVTDKSMTRSKKLSELIQPIDVRINELSKYVKDVDPFIDYKFEPISDPFGPAIVDQSLECIVVSQETVRGGEKINEIRIKKDMKPLDIIKIDLLNDFHKESEIEEQKISSSSLRIRKLGTIIKEPENKPNLPKKPYIIGLTGGIASGKSSVAEKLRTLGAGVINCDLMAHQTYESPESPAYKEIVKYFGQNILTNDLQIDRRMLGKIVFEDHEKLKVLNGIVWPKVHSLIHQRIDEMKDKYKVVVLEIALLLEAEWHHFVHQIWVTIVDESEAITRIQERNGLTPEEAKNRIKSQLTNEERVREANVVFCTHWDSKYTLSQVVKAWNQLQDYLSRQ